jgi:hypothetical protein
MERQTNRKRKSGELPVDAEAINAKLDALEIAVEMSGAMFDKDMLTVIAALRIALEVNMLRADLIAEVMQSHRDKRSPDYNECDSDPCKWCDDAKNAIDREHDIAEKLGVKP